MLGTIAGSPLFMAPENATGDSEPDARSDIYSLGCVAYYLLTGQPPFPGEQPIKILMAHVNDAVRRPSDVRSTVSSDLEQVVLQCLEKNPSDRPQSAAKLEGLLAACVDADQWSRTAANEWWSTVRPEGADMLSTQAEDLAPTIG
jgi:serine/threonine-protein kinase